jgi:hypothetical protein
MDHERGNSVKLFDVVAWMSYMFLGSGIQDLYVRISRRSYTPLNMRLRGLNEMFINASTQLDDAESRNSHTGIYASHKVLSVE